MSGPPSAEDGGLWLEALERGRVRLGLAPGWDEADLMVTGVELPPVGARLARGQPLLRLRVTSKVCTGETCTYVPSVRTFEVGRNLTVETLNQAVARDPMLLQEDPGGLGWLVEGRLDDTTQP